MQTLEVPIQPEIRRTPAEAAAFLNVQEATLASWRCTGKYTLPYLKIRNKVMYRQSDLDAFLRANTVVHGEVTE